MFARIAGRYDVLNHALSLGIDRRWRRRVVSAAGELRGRTALDLCCGTGDLTRLFERAGARVIGVDFTPAMLRRARAKLGSGAWLVEGDALALPLPGGAVDVAAVAFGIRNVADPLAALSEMARVVRPGGLVLVLEFSHPTTPPLAAAYRAYFTGVLPRVGRWVSGDGEAYEYLPRSVLRWPDPTELRASLEGAGLVECRFERFTGGIVCLHTGRVPGPP